jgi:hypothetical protein
MIDDRKLLFEPAESLTQESGRCQPCFLFKDRTRQTKFQSPETYAQLQIALPPDNFSSGKVNT